MKLKSLFKDGILMYMNAYVKFAGDEDDKHEALTIQTLRKYLIPQGLIKEYDVLGRKSKGNYLKSKGYYIANSKNTPFQSGIQTSIKDSELYQLNTINDYFNSTVYLRALVNMNDITDELKSKFKFLPESKKMSVHKKLITLITQFQLKLCDENQILKFINTQLSKDLKDFIYENSFDDNNLDGSSHEFGYWLNYLVDFYEISNSIELGQNIKSYFEKLHLIFVAKKMFYHDVIGKNKTCINVSGVILISKAFLRYSLITKDFRYTNASLFLIDFVKDLQLRNKGFIQNTFPIYKGNSKMKFPSWTLNYFLEALILKKQALHEFENSTIN
ncbi:hypothetical protein BFR04_05735 [Gaetbulibacter sp. 4G1]|nr:hypothetical protein [Gaetbulibacter sp. 4G1]PIA79022.1 hypothetical protein BFR04_05735 [Gaetbulibacter sp. 4G1]